jgi:hypothetical protein
MSRLPIFLTILDQHVILPGGDLGSGRNEFDFRIRQPLSFRVARKPASISARNEALRSQRAEM